MTSWLGGMAAAVMLALSPAARGQSDQKAPGVSVSMGGMKLYTDGNWSPVRARLSNPTGRDQRYTLAVTVDDLPHLQFARPLWLPAHTRRIVMIPVLPRLSEATLADKQVGIRSKLFEAGERGERLVFQRPSLLPVWSKDRFVTALLYSRADRDRASELVKKLKQSAGLAKRLVPVVDRDLPDRAGMLGSLSALVIAEPSPDLSLLQIRALHRWVAGGGRLWVMLDRVDPGFARRLLGAQWDMTVLGRAGVTRGTLRPTAGAGRGARARGGNETIRIDRDYPLAMRRVLAGPDQRVTHTVDGYPAVLWQRVGRGVVLFTTISPSAWLGKSGPGVDPLLGFIGPQPAGPAVEQASGAWESGPGGGGAQPGATLRQVAHQQIGYHVIGRALVLWVLGVYALAVLGAGLWLGRVGAMEYTAAAAIGLAVVGAGVLVAVGLVRQNQTPTTVAAGQLVSVTPGGLAHAQSRVAVYRRPGGAAAKSGGAKLGGARAWPMIHRGQVGSAPLRVRWDDHARWTLIGLPLGAGAIHPLTTRGFTRVGSRARVTARFTPRGLVGRVRAPAMSDLADCLVTAAQGRAAAALDGEGRFVIGDTQELGGDQFLAGGGVLQQQQIQRQGAYRRLLGSAASVARRSGPPLAGEDPVTLWGWTGAFQPPVKLLGQAGGKGAAARTAQSLVSLAVEPSRSAVGAKVHVPAVFLHRSVVTGTVYDRAHREWVSSLSSGQKFTMRFDVPPSVRPLRLSRATLTLNLNAPDRPIRVTLARGGQSVEAYRAPAIRGRQRIRLAGDKLPGAGPGPIDITVEVKDPPDGSSPQWSISRMELAVTGTVAPAPGPREQATQANPEASPEASRQTNAPAGE